jgi:hypothetical protein
VWSSVAVKWQLGSLWSGRLIYLVWSFQACVRLLYIYRRGPSLDKIWYVVSFYWWRMIRIVLTFLYQRGGPTPMPDLL